MHLIVYSIFIIIGLVAVFKANNNQWKESKTWYYNEKKAVWEEASYISFSSYAVKDTGKIVVPGMKDKE